jgi:hypothetical protein
MDFLSQEHGYVGEISGSVVFYFSLIRLFHCSIPAESTRSTALTCYFVDSLFNNNMLCEYYLCHHKNKKFLFYLRTYLDLLSVDLVPYIFFSGDLLTTLVV